jgi:hypothetical protein
MCTEFNAEEGVRNSLGWDNSNPDALKIEHIPNRTALRVTFNQERHEIKVSGLGGPAANSATYKIAVMPQSNETYISDENSQSVQAHEIARKILDGLLGI